MAAHPPPAAACRSTRSTSRPPSTASATPPMPRTATATAGARHAPVTLAARVAAVLQLPDLLRHERPPSEPMVRRAVQRSYESLQDVDLDAHLDGAAGSSRSARWRRRCSCRSILVARVPLGRVAVGQAVVPRVEPGLAAADVPDRRGPEGRPDPRAARRAARAARRRARTAASTRRTSRSRSASAGGRKTTGDR